VPVSVPVNSVRELIEYAKTRPGALNWGSWGVGSFPHLYMAWLQSVSATSYTHVPYKSIGQAVGAVAAGEVQVLLNTPGLMAPLVKAGKIRALAVVGHRRLPHMDVPTLKEAGFEPPIISWVGVTLPVGTPREVVMRYNGEINKLLADTKFVERVLWPVSIDAVGGTPEEFAAFLKKDRELTERVAKLAEIKRE
jgi:tripartite-type tricarboxylate transporter receptor subunit TctC